MSSENLTLKRGNDVLIAEDANEGKPCMVIYVGYQDLDSWCGVFLTPHKVEQLHAWLGAWLKQHPR